jgi:putative DNA primase/helicase
VDDRKAALKWALRSENRPRRDHLLACAATVERIAVDGHGWDTRPWLLGVRNGVIDLGTGRLRAGDPTDAITKVAPVRYDPHARCPRFARFMREIFAEAPELVPYLLRCLGYVLTGVTSEQVFWILWGLGANGKSTLLEVILHDVLGAKDYGWIMPFPAAGWSNAMTEYQKAMLVGRRFVTASEVTRAGHLNEELIKALTGEDTINARHPYGRPFQYVPVAKFFLRVNEKPIIQSHGMWRRPKLVPFTQRFAVDRRLRGDLQSEAEGILARLVCECLEWQRDGLRHPAIVEAATNAYRADSDPLAGFFDACCVMGDPMRVGGREAFAAYRGWCEVEQLPADERMSQTAFGTAMKERFRDVGSDRKAIYAGVGLKHSPETNTAPPTSTADTEEGP